MVGIVLASHGGLADGLLHTAKFFYGDVLPQVMTVSLDDEASPQGFREKMRNAVSEVDSGDGVLLLVDLLGGTPCSQSAYLMSDRVQVVAGMNLIMVMDAFGKRDMAESIEQIDIEELIEAGRGGIVSLNRMMVNRE